MKTAAEIVEERKKERGMSSDTLWVALRYFLLMGGSAIAGRGWVSLDKVNTFVDALPTVVAAVTAAGTAVWGLYVRMGTKAVPLKTANRDDVPTVNPVTGVTEPTTKK